MFLYISILLNYFLLLASSATTSSPSVLPTFSPTYNANKLTSTNCSVFVEGLPSSQLFINQNLTSINKTISLSVGEVASIDFKYFWENQTDCFNCPVTLYSGVEGRNSTCVNGFTNNEIVNTLVNLKFSIVVAPGCQLIYAASSVGSSKCQNPKGGVIVGSVYGTSSYNSFRFPKVIVYYVGLVLILITVVGCLIACLFNTGQWIRDLTRMNKYN